MSNKFGSVISILGYGAFWTLLVVTTADLLAQLFFIDFWLFDLFSNFKPFYAALAAISFVILLFTGKKLATFISLILIMVHGYPLLPLFLENRDIAVENEYIEAIDDSGEKGNEITIMQFNVNHADRDIYDRVKWILENRKKFDVILLFEVTEEWNKILYALAGEYPYNFIRPIRGKRGIAIFTRLPDAKFRLNNINGTKMHYVSMRSLTDSKGDMVMYILHPPPPLSADMYATRNKMLIWTAGKMSEENARYRIIAGDLNITRWSPHFTVTTTLSGLRDSFEGFGLSRTWPAFLPSPFGIVIDNMLISPDNIYVVKKEVGSNIGSDHVPVMTTIRLN